MSQFEIPASLCDYHARNPPERSPARVDDHVVFDARPILPTVSFFMGDMRDGLPMINMQSLYLMSCKNFDEKQIGVLFFVFGISQVIFMTPAGYFLDYSNSKITWVIRASIAVSTLTVLTALFAQPNGENMNLMILIHFLQGGVTALLPPGFNGITLGIVGSTGFTHQVSRNKMMNHIGTALIVSMASLVAYFTYPNIGLLFVASPLACLGVVYYLGKIKPEHIDKDAARGLIIQSPTMTEYEEMDEQNEVAQIMDTEDEVDDAVIDYGDLKDPKSNDDARNNNHKYVPPDSPTDLNSADDVKTAETSSSSLRSKLSKGPSYVFGFFESLGSSRDSLSIKEVEKRKAQTPLAVLKDSRLIIFTTIVFLFHLANSSILPLVMQSIALDDPHEGILLSGLCILVGQAFMMIFAKICGDYSPIWGRKNIFLVGLFALPIRCLALVLIFESQEFIQEWGSLYIMHCMIISTQLLDAVGAGISGTMYILVTNDISGGTGRFSLMIAVTTSAMCLGGTMSGYIGQALAQDYGYSASIGCLGMISLLPAFIYLIFMPETLPDYAKSQSKEKKKRILNLLKKLREMRRGKKPKKDGESSLKAALSPVYEIVFPDRKQSSGVSAIELI